MPPFTMERGNVGVSSRMTSKTRGALVAVQLAFCVVLLVGAGLGAAHRTPPGAGRCRVPAERGSYGSNIHFERNAPGILQATAGPHSTTARSGVCRNGEYDPAARRHPGRHPCRSRFAKRKPSSQRNQAQSSGDSNRHAGLLPHAGRAHPGRPRFQRAGHERIAAGRWSSTSTWPITTGRMAAR